jgi:hypothetical protein
MSCIHKGGNGLKKEKKFVKEETPEINPEVPKNSP